MSFILIRVFMRLTQNYQWLLQRGCAGLRALAVLVARAAGKANSSDNLSSREQRAAKSF